MGSEVAREEGHGEAAGDAEEEPPTEDEVPQDEVPQDEVSQEGVPAPPPAVIHHHQQRWHLGQLDSAPSTPRLRLRPSRICRRPLERESSRRRRHQERVVENPQAREAPHTRVWILESEMA